MGTTVIVITHDKNLVDDFSKRVIALKSGQIISDTTGGYNYNEHR
jgi:cell division transport system ATP-binding protein